MIVSPKEIKSYHKDDRHKTLPLLWRIQTIVGCTLLRRCRPINSLFIPKWFTPKVVSNPSSVFDMTVPCMTDVRPALLHRTWSGLPILWNFSANSRTDFKDPRSNCNEENTQQNSYSIRHLGTHSAWIVETANCQQHGDWAAKGSVVTVQPAVSNGDCTVSSHRVVIVQHSDSWNGSFAACVVMVILSFTI